MGEDKKKGFEKSFEILGAVETLPDAGDNAIQVSNKRSRLKQIQEQVEELTGLLGSSAPRSRLESLCCTRPDTHMGSAHNLLANFCTSSAAVVQVFP
jgi:hypothetical protein